MVGMRRGVCGRVNGGRALAADGASGGQCLLSTLHFFAQQAGGKSCRKYERIFRLGLQPCFLACFLDVAADGDRWGERGNVRIRGYATSG
jgi:hypothetical protein